MSGGGGGESGLTVDIRLWPEAGEEGVGVGVDTVGAGVEPGVVAQPELGGGRHPRIAD